MKLVFFSKSGRRWHPAHKKIKYGKTSNQSTLNNAKIQQVM